MKFDTIIANPPYSGNLHYKVIHTVVNNALAEGGNMVSLEPLTGIVRLAQFDPESPCHYNMMQELIELDPHVKNITHLMSTDVDKAFGIQIEATVGIWQIIKSEVTSDDLPTELPEDSKLRVFVRKYFGMLAPLYNKVCKPLLGHRGKHISLADAFSRNEKGTIYKLLPEDLASKPFIRFGGALGGHGMFKATGDIKGDLLNILDVSKADLNDKKLSTSGGGYLTFDRLGKNPEEGREKVLNRLHGTGNWLCRACSLTAKSTRNLLPQFIPFIDPDDDRPDDQIAKEDFGMTDEEIGYAKQWFAFFIGEMSVEDFEAAVADFENFLKKVAKKSCN